MYHCIHLTLATAYLFGVWFWLGFGLSPANLSSSPLHHLYLSLHHLAIFSLSSLSSHPYFSCCRGRMARENLFQVVICSLTLSSFTFQVLIWRRLKIVLGILVQMLKTPLLRLNRTHRLAFQRANFLGYFLGACSLIRPFCVFYDYIAFCSNFGFRLAKAIGEMLLYCLLLL